MAIVHEINEADWLKWVETRPESIRKMCRDFPPNKLYKLNTTGHRCMIYSYSEDGTMTVNVTGEYNFVIFERAVFGIRPEDLTECDLPSKDEKLGAVLSQEEGESFLRGMADPDNRKAH